MTGLTITGSLRSKHFRLVSEQKKDRGKGFSVLTVREIKRKPKNERGGGGGEGCCLSFFPTPPRSFTCTIFRAVFDSCSSFFAPDRTETLVAQANNGVAFWSCKC